MNKYDAHLFLPLVQALADGKDLQVLNNAQVWVEFNDIGFSLDVSKYRIKPEPREVWFVENPTNGFLYYESFKDEKLARTNASNNLAYTKVVKFREVIE